MPSRIHNPTPTSTIESRNGTRQPQVRNCSPDIWLKTSTARFATDAIAIMTKDRGADRTRDEADRIDAECFKSANPRIGIGKIEFRKDETGDCRIEKKVVPLDRRADGRRNHGAP